MALVMHCLTCYANLEKKRKPPPDVKSLATFLHALLDSGKRQLAVIGNASDHTPIRAKPLYKAS